MQFRINPGSPNFLSALFGKRKQNKMWGGRGSAGGGGGAQYVPKNTAKKGGANKTTQGRGRGRGRGGSTQPVRKSGEKEDTTTATTELAQHTQHSDTQQLEKGAEGGLTLYTCGYGGMKQIDQLIDLLAAHKISILLDIRIHPHCGFNQDFSEKGLKNHLKQEGIGYEHFMELGTSNLFCRFKIHQLTPTLSKGNIWRSNGGPMSHEDRIELYTELLEKAGELLTRRLRETIADPQSGNVAILCGCGDYRECHRSLVAAYLEKEYQFSIVHM